MLKRAAFIGLMGGLLVGLSACLVVPTSPPKPGPKAPPPGAVTPPPPPIDVIRPR